MAYQQVAKLYLRGSLCNKTMKELSAQQQEEIDGILDRLIDDNLLRKCKRSFCGALAGTIHNDYDIREAGEQDYLISIWRAAVAALHGKEPAKETITDPTQRKKWFQTWAFNYLRQILRENKIPSQKLNVSITVPADEAAVFEIRDALVQLAESEKFVPHRRLLRSLLVNLEVKEGTDSLLLTFDHMSFPTSIFDIIKELNTTYLTRNVEILYTAEGILVRRLSDNVPAVSLKRSTENFVKVTSYDVSDEDGEKSKFEVIATPREDKMEADEIFKKLHERVPDDGHEILAIYNEDSRPQGYVEKYGAGSPKISHVAEYLNRSPREVKKMLGIIRLQCMALKLGY